MNFLNLGPMELVLIGVIALIAVGPRKLPELGRMVGKWMKVVREASDEMKRGLYLEDEIRRPLPPKPVKQVQPIPHQPPKEDEPEEIVDATLVSEESTVKDAEASEEAARGREAEAIPEETTEQLAQVTAPAPQGYDKPMDEPED